MRPLLLLVIFAAPSAAQSPVDPGLAAYIASIKAIDNHAHPMRLVAPGLPPDTEFDALPLDGIPAFDLPWRLKPEAPVWAAASRALYGVSTGVAAARARVARERGDGFTAWVLDRTGIDVMLANRIAPAPGIAGPRFRWVPFDDALLFPLDTRGEAARTPDTRLLYPRLERILARYLQSLGRTGIPPTLAAYVHDVVFPTLERQHDSGAVAIKFEAAYLRTLAFGVVDTARAQDVYTKYATGGTPTPEETKVLADALFRFMAWEAGRLGLAVHLHVLGYFGGFYGAEGARPGLLEPVFNDSMMRGTNFVLIHGGWPQVAETEAMLAKPNVYADMSMMDLILSPAELAPVLRGWLMRWPDKVLFGTDAYDGGPDQGWEQWAWVASTTARRALGIALTGMMRDGDVTPAQARALAKKVLRDNAIALYHLNGVGTDTPR